jgi:hypothetical protein
MDGGEGEECRGYAVIRLGRHCVISRTYVLDNSCRRTIIREAGFGFGKCEVETLDDEE